MWSKCSNETRSLYEDYKGQISGYRVPRREWDFHRQKSSPGRPYHQLLTGSKDPPSQRARRCSGWVCSPTRRSPLLRCLLAMVRLSDWLLIPHASRVQASKIGSEALPRECDPPEADLPLLGVSQSVKANCHISFVFLEHRKNRAMTSEPSAAKANFFLISILHLLTSGIFYPP